MADNPEYYPIGMIPIFVTLRSNKMLHILRLFLLYINLLIDTNIIYFSLKKKIQIKSINLFKIFFYLFDEEFFASSIMCFMKTF